MVVFLTIAMIFFSYFSFQIINHDFNKIFQLEIIKNY